jgi:hypothetical protein
LRREAGFPKVRIAVVGVGTGELFNNLKEGLGQLDVAFSPSKGWFLPSCSNPFSDFFAKYNMVPTDVLYGHLNVCSGHLKLLGQSSI